MFAFFRTHRLALSIVTYFIFTTIAIFAILPDWGNDDPYITYRFAENLYAGRGFVYNPGENILSTTSPLFALVLAGVRVFWSNLPRAANLIGAASLAGGALFLWDMARQWKEPRAGWAGLVLYPTFGLLVSTLGSETPVYLALCLGALSFYVKRRYTTTASLLAFSILFMGDAFVLVCVIALDWLLKNPLKTFADLRKLPWKAIALGTAILLVWAAFAIPYFGSPLPITLAVKRAQGLMNISEKFAPGFLTILRPYTRNFYFWTQAGLLVAGGIYALRKARAWCLLIAWAVLYFIAYTVLGVTRYFWYYAPLVPAMVGMIGLGAVFMQHIPHPSSTIRRALSWGAILALGWVAISQAAVLPRLRQHPDERLQAYRLVGEWLTHNTLPQARIGTLEVGVIGYYVLPRPMIDFAGLIQPEVADLFAPETTYQNTAIYSIIAYQPDFIVLHDGLFPYLEETLITKNCLRVQRFPGAQTGYSLSLSVYQCQYP